MVSPSKLLSQLNSLLQPVSSFASSLPVMFMPLGGAEQNSKTPLSSDILFLPLHPGHAQPTAESDILHVRGCPVGS